MRSDNRAADALRDVRLQLGVSPYAEGSAIIEFGRTRVLCTATIEEKVPPHRKESGGGWVTAEYGMLPRATHTRNSREGRNSQSGRTMEIQRLIGRSLRAACNLDLLGPRQIIVDCDVLIADGGTRTASITGGYVALAMAVQHLLNKKKIERSPLTQSVQAVSVGILHGEAILDLCYEEDSRAEVDLNLVVAAGQHIVEIQGTAEGKAFSEEDLYRMVTLAKAGCAQLAQKQEAALRELGGK